MDETLTVIVDELISTCRDEADVRENTVVKLDATIPAVLIRELAGKAKEFSNKKAPGSDGIRARVLKAIIQNYPEMMFEVYTKMIRTSYYPRAWKYGNVILQRKPKKYTGTPKDLRPITLLSNLGKLLEKLVIGRCEWIMNEEKRWPGKQFGFPQGEVRYQPLESYAGTCRIVDKMEIMSCSQRST